MSLPPDRVDTFCMDRIERRGTLYACTVCLGKDGQPIVPMFKSQMAEHVTGTRHRKRLRLAEVRDLDHLGPTASDIIAPEPDLPAPVVAHDSDSPLSQVVEPPINPPPVISAPHFHSHSDFVNAPPAPLLDFFLDSAYGSVDLQGFVPSTLPINHFGFPELAQEVPGPSADTFAPPNPYDDMSWYPYPSRALFLTHSLFNSPALQFSETQQSAILDWAKEMGTSNVPSMYQLDKCGKAIKDLTGDPTRMLRTDTGHVWYLNRIDTMLRQDFSNPNVRQHLEFYPDECDGHLSEVWHGNKMTLGKNRKRLTPMASYGGRSYFVNEISALDDGSLFLTDMFLKRHGELTARGRKLEAQHMEDRSTSVYRFSNELIDCPLSRFQLSCVELRDLHPNGITLLADVMEMHERLLSHPLRERANGREVVSVPFIVFMDDVSGNKSKQWNKHYCCYASNASLPRQKINERLNIRFMATSQHASPIEILKGVSDMFEEAFNDPIEVWDLATGREILVRPYIHLISGDNPMQAEECSTSGLRSNLFCRTCMAGGSRAFKVSEDGYSKQMEIGVLRTPKDTIECIKKQYEIAFTSKSVQTLLDEQRDSGVKDTIAQPYLDSIVKRRQELQKTASLKLPEITAQLREEFAQRHSELPMNPLLSMDDFDVHLDTPTETLHTILLGVAKYLWVESIQQLDKGHNFPLFSTRLRSISVAGLDNGPISSYITSNRGSLNGKHFKTLLQTAPFCLHNLVQRELIQSWIALGRLTVLAWHTSIENIDNYVAEFYQSIYDFLYTAIKFMPALMVGKAKAHLLLHMPLFVQRFGPLLGPNSERYESFNATFRAASIHSNRQAPSRDIANSFATFDTVKHILLGGYWMDKRTKQVVCAGKSVASMRTSSTFIQRLLGTKPPKANPGTIDVSNTSVSGTWEQLAPPQAPRPITIDPGCHFRCATSMYAQNGDRVMASCNVAFYLGIDSCPSLGRILNILSPIQGGLSSVILQAYQWLELDSDLYMPAVLLEERLLTVDSTAIICEINLQHRCAKGGCPDTGTEVIRQERQDSGLTRPSIQHKDDINFVVNTSSIHNYKTIQSLVRDRFDSQAPFQSPGNYLNIRRNAIASFQTRTSHTGKASHLVPESLPPEQGTLSTIDSSTHAGPSAPKKRRRGLTSSNDADLQVPSVGRFPLPNSHSTSITQGQPRGPPTSTTEQSNEPMSSWRAIWSTEYQKYYYYDLSTGEASWNNPYPI